MDIWLFLDVATSPMIMLIISALTAILLLRNGHRYAAVYLILSVLLSVFITYIFKLVFKIRRPCYMLPYCPTTFSFPSGHATGVFSFSTSLAIIFRKGVVLLLYILSFLISISRIVYNVHTIVDVVVGASIGMLVPLLIYKKIPLTESKT